MQLKILSNQHQGNMKHDNLTFWQIRARTLLIKANKINNPEYNKTRNVKGTA